MEGAEPFVVFPGEGEMLALPVAGPTRILARPETTNGGFTALENVSGTETRFAPPEHIHVREEEMYYVVEGTIRFKADGRYFDAPAGAFMLIPRSTRHCFRNIGEGSARLLMMFAPAGMERFFEGHAAMPLGQMDPGAYRRVAHAAWMEVVGPPMEPGEGNRDWIPKHPTGSQRSVFGG